MCAAIARALILSLIHIYEFIIALSALIKRLAVDHLHIVGDVFDRGGSADKILDLLYDYHSLDIDVYKRQVLRQSPMSSFLRSLCM